MKVLLTRVPQGFVPKRKKGLSIEDRLSRLSVAVDSGCTEWLGSLHRDGHGKINVSGKIMAAHRVSFEIANGPIPAGSLVLHRCGNACCINPLHLYLGDDLQNSADKKIHGTALSGEGIVWHKITDLQAEIIKRIAFYRGGKAALSRHLGISASTLTGVLKGKSWKS